MRWTWTKLRCACIFQTCIHICEFRELNIHKKDIELSLFNGNKDFFLLIVVVWIWSWINFASEKKSLFVVYLYRIVFCNLINWKHYSSGLLEFPLLGDLFLASVRTISSLWCMATVDLALLVDEIHKNCTTN